MKIPENVITFASGDLTLYKAFADYWNHYRSLNGARKFEYRDEVERDGKMVKISFDEKEHQLNEMLKKEILRHSGLSNLNEFPLATYASNPNLVWAAFAVVQSLIDMVLPDTMIDSIGMFTDVRTGGFGDSFAFDIEPRDIFVVSKAGRNQRTGEIHRQERGQVVVIPENHIITVGVNFYRVLAGKDSLAKFVSKAAAGMETQMAFDCYNSFATTMAALDNAGDDALRVAGYTQTDLVTLGQKVSAWNNSKAVVVGTQLALANILPADPNYRYDLTSDYVKMGRLRTAFGFDFLELPQLADWRTPFLTLIDNAKLWILSPGVGKIVKLCLEGSTLSYASGVYDSPNMSQTTTIQKSWGVGVATSSVAAVITL